MKHAAAAGIFRVFGVPIPRKRWKTDPSFAFYVSSFMFQVSCSKSYDHLLPPRARSDERDGNAGLFLDEGNVALRFPWQRGERADALRRRVPSGEHLERRPPASRGHGDGDALLFIQYVDLGEIPVRESVQLVRSPKIRDREPPAPAGTPRRRPVLPSPLADALRRFRIRLGRKRAGPHARAVRLQHPDAGSESERQIG